MAGQEARDARDAGIDTAVAHADRINPAWRDLAYAELVAFAQRTPVFTIEQLRASLNDRLEEPPSLRAWGGIAQRAVRAGIIVHHGWREAENPACHCGEVRVWRSTKFAAATPRHRTPFSLAGDDARSALFATPVEISVCALADRWLERAKRHEAEAEDEFDVLEAGQREHLREYAAQLRDLAHELRRSIEEGRKLATGGIG